MSAPSSNQRLHWNFRMNGKGEDKREYCLLTTERQTPAHKSSQIELQIEQSAIGVADTQVERDQMNSVSVEWSAGNGCRAAQDGHPEVQFRTSRAGSSSQARVRGVSDDKLECQLSLKFMWWRVQEWKYEIVAMQPTTETASA